MERIYLHGSEDVRQAGLAMQSAADDIQRAANQIDCSLVSFLEQFNQAIGRLEQLKEQK